MAKAKAKSASGGSVKKTKGKPRGKPFKPGQAPGPGRPKGVPNKATAEARDLARNIVRDPAYLANLAERARTGELNSAVENSLWHYAYGKPKETVEHQGLVGLLETHALIAKRRAERDKDDGSED